MRIFFALLIVFTASATLAQENEFQTKDGFKHSWVCMAEGQDPASGRYVEVSGDNRPTLSQAQQSAVESCEHFGLMGCTYNTCIDEGHF